MDNHSSPSRPYKVLLAATGSVAAIKIAQLSAALRPIANIKIILTESSKQFVDLASLKEMGVEVYSDQDERTMWTKRGDPVLHIQLRKWADALIIAPLSANTLAKIANGICDNLVSLVIRCWDMQLKNNRSGLTSQSSQLKKPVIVCPAMNTMMWSHPITAQQLSKLRSWGITIVEPVQKLLMCGDAGKGAMADVQTIVGCLCKRLEEACREEGADEK